MASIWKMGKLNYVRRVYGPYVESFKDHDDDRRVYVNIYRGIIEALEAIREDPHPYIKAAISGRLREDYDILDRIIGAFSGMQDKTE